MPPLMTLTLLILSLMLILLCCLALFYVCKCHICLPISAHGLTYVNLLYWIVGIYRYLVNEGIDPILVIQTFYILRMSTQPLLLYDPLLSFYGT